MYTPKKYLFPFLYGQHNCLFVLCRNSWMRQQLVQEYPHTLKLHKIPSGSNQSQLVTVHDVRTDEMHALHKLDHSMRKSEYVCTEHYLEFTLDADSIITYSLLSKVWLQSCLTNTIARFNGYQVHLDYQIYVTANEN